MRNPTPIEREHYEKLVGRQILAVLWQDLEGEPLPILVLNGQDRPGSPATICVLADPEGNGPGFLEHDL